MQRVNNRLASTILGMYNSGGNLNARSYYNNRDLNYENNNVYSLFFKVNLQGDTVEIPILCKDRVQNALINMLTETDMEGNPVNIRKDVTIPFCSSAVSVGVSRTADALFRRLVTMTPDKSWMFTQQESSSGEVYYGSDGVIFNKDMTPIFFITIECDILGGNNNYWLEYKKVKTYVHPSVFYTDNIIEKCIVNKVIPYVLSNGVYVFKGSTYIKDSFCRNKESSMFIIPEIVVADITDKFFYRPILPSVEFKNEDINTMLKDNINAIMSCMK